jgi:prepilin-type N-terminal cleavage/methylation domain-containing protein
MLKTNSIIARMHSNQSGFTLIEMLMATAIVIVGLVAVARLCDAGFQQSQ